MRTPLLVAALSLSIIGCTIGDSGTTPGGGDDDTSDPGNPGTGTNPGSGTPAPTPSVTSAVDRATVATELGKQEIVTLNLTSVGGFTGAVTIAPSFVDAAGNALATVTVTGETSVNLTANQATPVAFTVKIPTDLTGADTTATLKLDVTSSAGTTHLTSAFDVAAVLTVVYANGLAANQVAHPGRALVYSVKLGTKINLKNEDATPNIIHITHADGAFPHETTGPTGGLFGNTYVIDTAKNKVGDTGNIGCHSHGTATYSKVTVVQ